MAEIAPENLLARADIVGMLGDVLPMVMVREDGGAEWHQHNFDSRSLGYRLVPELFKGI